MRRAMLAVFLLALGCVIGFLFAEPPDQRSGSGGARPGLCGRSRCGRRPGRVWAL